MEKKITKKMQFDIIRSVRKQFMALQTAVRAEDRDTAEYCAREISRDILRLETAALEAQLAGTNNE